MAAVLFVKITITTVSMFGLFIVTYALASYVVYFVVLHYLSLLVYVLQWQDVAEKCKILGINCLHIKIRATGGNKTKTPGPGGQSALRALARAGMKIGRIEVGSLPFFIVKSPRKCVCGVLSLILPLLCVLDSNELLVSSCVQYLGCQTSLS